jgi:hypothetical protein
MIAPILFTQVFSLSIPRLPGAPFWLASVLLAGSFATVWSVFRSASQPAVAEAAQ